MLRVLVFLLGCTVACNKAQETAPEPPKAPALAQPEVPAEPEKPAQPTQPAQREPTEAVQPGDPSVPKVTRGKNGEIVISNHPLDNYKIEKKNGQIHISNTGKDPAVPSAPSAPTTAEKAPAAPAAPTAPAVEGEVDTSALRDYLAKIDKIQVGPSGDAKQVADELVQAAGRGNTDGLAKLIDDIDGAKKRLDALAPPEAAREHHAMMKRLLDDSGRFLGQLKAAIESKDINALMAFTSSARTLEAHTKKLEALEKALRAKL